jgi:hypothetical protein
MSFSFLFKGGGLGTPESASSEHEADLVSVRNYSLRSVGEWGAQYLHGCRFGKVLAT